MVRNFKRLTIVNFLFPIVLSQVVVLEEEDEDLDEDEGEDDEEPEQQQQSTEDTTKSQ